MEILTGKNELRIAAKARLREFLAGGCNECRQILSGKMVSALVESKTYIASTTLVGYLPMKSEPDVLPALQKWLDYGRRLLLPMYCEDTSSYALGEVKGLGNEWLSTGKFGILEPLNHLQRIYPPYTMLKDAIWLVPGLAFTISGCRLGRGGGFYDRLLEGASGVRIGVSFGFQIFDYIPCGPHDIKMDVLLTESGIINIGSRR